MLSRRLMLSGLASLLGAATLPFSPRTGRGAPSSARKFIFVFNVGGWDPLCVFAPLFGSSNVDMQMGTSLATAGGIDFVDHPDRPAVASFFERWHGKSLLLNGVSVPSVSHDVCQTLMLTGATSMDRPDWPALLAAAREAEFTLPHLVLGGPSFPGPYGSAVSRTGYNGQLQSLLSRDILMAMDSPVTGPGPLAERVIDRYLGLRASARAGGAKSTVEATLTTAFEDAVGRASALKDRRYDLNLSGGGDFTGRLQVAVEALALGVTRCVTLDSDGLWDSHFSNDTTQSFNFEALFTGLGSLMEQLDQTPGQEETTLAEETVVVVMSEMGRTPLINSTDGRDHWPYTSVLLMGPGLTTDRVVGSFNDAYFGEMVDPASAELADSGTALTSESLGATLLALADVDPEAHLPGVEPLQGVLA